jgi:hypothetical protein
MAIMMGISLKNPNVPFTHYAYK